MKELQITTISPSGKVTTQKDIVAIWITPENYVRGFMCWYSDGTKFIIKDNTGEIQMFAKVPITDPVAGYTDLIQLDYVNDLFDLLEVSAYDSIKLQKSSGIHSRSV